MANAHKYVYLFSEGNGSMRELLGALAAQQFAHVGVAFGEQVAVLFAHMISPLIFARNRLNI